MGARYGRLRTAVERSIHALKTAGDLDLERQAAILCSVRYQADMIDSSKGHVGYNDWRTFNSTCSALGFDPVKTATAAASEPVQVNPRNDMQEYLSKFG
jgi:hypothetical protein